MISAYLNVWFVRSRQTMQQLRESIEAVDRESVVGLVLATNASDWASSFEFRVKSGDVAGSCSKIGADPTLNAPLP